MHPKAGYYHLNQLHVADLRHQAQRHALARAARRARQALAVLSPRNHPPAPAYGGHAPARHQPQLNSHAPAPGR